MRSCATENGCLMPDPARYRRYETMYEAYIKAYEGLSSSGTFEALARIQASD